MYKKCSHCWSASNNRHTNYANLALIKPVHTREFELSRNLLNGNAVVVASMSSTFANGKIFDGICLFN